MRPLAVFVSIAVATTIGACGAKDDPQPSRIETSPETAHIHGVGVNPADGALFVATHRGLFRTSSDGTEMVRVGEPRDTMGFAVVGPDRFSPQATRTCGATSRPFSV